jgi:ketosteroid isomerase-like protein
MKKTKPTRAIAVLAVGAACLIKLPRSLDAGTPTLEAEVLATTNSRILKVVITSGHPVWRGCVLSKGYFSLVRVTSKGL